MDYSTNHRHITELAYKRHAQVWPFFVESIDLGHLFYNRQADFVATFAPGIPNTRTVRTAINDLSCRAFRFLMEPLIEDGILRSHRDGSGGDEFILPDGLPVRIKKGDKFGVTSNVPTRARRNQGKVADLFALYPGQCDLDLFIEEGGGIDVVFVANAQHGVYDSVGLRISEDREKGSAFPSIDPVGLDALAIICSDAADAAAELRRRVV